MVWKSASARSFGAAYLATSVIQNARLDVKVEGAHSFGIILNTPAKVNFTKLLTGKCVF